MADEQKPGINKPRSNGENAADRQRRQDEEARGEGGASASGAGTMGAAANLGDAGSVGASAGPAGGASAGSTGTSAAGAAGRASGGPDVGGEMAGGQSEGKARRPVDELSDAYDKAREELNQAVGSLRSELGRVDLNSARRRAKKWVDENPTLTLFIGIGAGILAGRLLSKAFRKPPVTVRARRQAEVLGDQFSDVAEEIGEAVAHAVSQATRSIGEVGARTRKPAEKMVRRAREFGGDVADTAGRTVEFLGDAADDVGRTIRKESAKAGKKARKSVDRGIDLSDAAVNALRTAVAAVVVKKVARWMKNMR